MDEGARSGRGEMRPRRSRAGALRDRLLGWLWLGAWVLILHGVHAPWRELGGLVSERARWTERLALGVCFLAGCFVGHGARRAASRGEGRTHARLVRWIWILPSALTALVLVALRFRGETAGVGVAFNAWLAYWAGTDATLAAWPLAGGRHYSFRGGIRSEV